MQGVFETVPGVQLHIAEQASEGVKLSKHLQPDLILLDMHLPDQSGAWVIECVKQIPGCEQIPILIVSADATERERKRLLDMGAMAYITKPFNVQELLAVVQSILGSSRHAA